MNYQYLLFDLDNTLLDFTSNEAQSFQHTMRDHHIPYSTELYDTYKTINHDLWQAAEREEITIAEILRTRFTKLMEHYDQQVDGMAFEKTYRSYLNQGIQEMPYVHEVLSQLSKTHQLYIITNGVTKTQQFRMAGSKLDQYFIQIFISEQIGANKPSSIFFDYVKENIPHFDCTQALVIGDTLSSDILGGNLAGIDTCWLCAKGTENTTDILPTYTIHSLLELLAIA